MATQRQRAAWAENPENPGAHGAETTSTAAVLGGSCAGVEVPAQRDAGLCTEPDPGYSAHIPHTEQDLQAGTTTSRLRLVRGSAL